MATDQISFVRAPRTKSEDLSISVKISAVKPERNLLAAILGRAILDLYGDAITDRLTIANARGWLYAPIKEEEEFSFGWVARQLDLNPHIIQEQLKGFSHEREHMLKCLNYLR